MNFTDDDLKQLKKDAIYRNQTRRLALIARLEASEARAETLWKCNAMRCEPWPCKEAKDKDEAWREKAGKK